MHTATRLQASIDVVGFGLVVAALLFTAFNALFGENLLGKIGAKLGGDTAGQPPSQPPSQPLQHFRSPSKHFAAVTAA